MDLGDKKADSHQIKQVTSLETARTQAFMLPPSLSYPLSLYLGLNRESLSLSCHFPKGPKWITTSHFSFGLQPLVVQLWRELGSACSSHVAPWWEGVLKPHCRSHLLCAMEWQQFGETHLPTVSRLQSNIKTRCTHSSLKLLFPSAQLSLRVAFSSGCCPPLVLPTPALKPPGCLFGQPLMTSGMPTGVTDTNLGATG